MLRKTLGTVTAIAALCVGSAAMAAHMGGGGGGGGRGGGWGGGGGMMHGGGRAPMVMNGAGSMGPMMRAGPMTAAPMTRSPTTTAPVTGGRVQGWNGRTAWGGRFHDHFHNRHNRFFAFGFGGPIYDYAYGSCWTQVPTYYGLQWVYACGDYSDWGY